MAFLPSAIIAAISSSVLSSLGGRFGKGWLQYQREPSPLGLVSWLLADGIWWTFPGFGPFFRAFHKVTSQASVPVMLRA